MKKIRSLTTLDDIIAESSKDPEYKKGLDLALKKLDLAHKIMKNREKAKMTQAEFAKELNTSQSFVARIESGTQNITIEVLYKIANVLSRKLKKSIKFNIEGSVS